MANHPSTDNLSDQQQLFTEAQLLSGLGCFEWNLTTNDCKWSDEMHRIYGTTPGERISGDRFLEFVVPENRDEVTVAFTAAIQTCGSIQREKIIRRPDGEIRALECRCRVVAGAGGKPERLIGICFDITDRKRVQEIELNRRESDASHWRRMQAVGRLAKGIAHDFKNALTVISTYAELLLDHVDDDANYSSIKAIQMAADRATMLTTQLLLFSRNSVATKQVFDLNELIRTSEPLLRSLAGEQTTLIVKLGADPGLVKSDKVQIEQVLLSLVTNARDAMPDGGALTLETSLRYLHEDQSSGLNAGFYFQLEVTDDGCGMDNETLSRCFEPFFTTMPVGKGTGMGLAVTYGVIKESGGQIYVDSQRDNGTTFTLLLPRMDAPDDAESQPDFKQKHEKTVLQVDDEDGVRAVTK